MRRLQESLKGLQFFGIGLGTLGHTSVNVSMTAVLCVDTVKAGKKWSHPWQYFSKSFALCIAYNDERSESENS